jgi:hypothetical protein
MFNIYVDVRGVYPTLIHGMRVFPLSGHTRSVTIEAAVLTLLDSGQIAETDSLVTLVKAWQYARNN